MAAESDQIESLEKAVATGNRSFLSRISEDIWAVWISSLLIAAIVLIAFISSDQKFTIPVYQWAGADDLLTKVISWQNLLIVGLIGVVFFLLSSVAAVATGISIKKYLAGFSIIYVSAILSLIVAGNKSVSYYGIEYVVFALLTGLLMSNLLRCQRG